MNSNNKELNNVNKDQGCTAQKRPYDKPVLVKYGDVRDVTLGPTPGLLESGGTPSDPRCDRSQGGC